VNSASVTLVGAPKLVVGGAPVLTKTLLAGCVCVACKPKGSEPVCTSVASVAGGFATKLVVSGSQALLPSVSATGGPAPHPISKAPGPTAQTKMEAI
jgi:hypothetical protein